MNSYIELNWLRGRDNDIPLPKIVIVNNYIYAGAYFHPRNDYVYNNGRIVDLKKGLIAICSELDDPGSTIAHEWRHHWQFFNGIDFDNIQFDHDKCYKNETIKYYCNSKTEMDALLFEIKMYPDDDNQLYYEWILKRPLGGTGRHA